MQMSIHRALAELKLLSKRIQRGSRESFIELRHGNEAPSGYESAEEFEKEAKASLASVEDLIERRNEIKSKIILSNANTMVKIGDKEMTVAAAIDQKEAIGHKMALLDSLRSQYTAVERAIQNEMPKIEERLEKRIEGDLGSKDRKDSAEEVEKITENFMKRYKPNMLDPVSIRSKIKELTEEIELFETEIDFVLSESNTITMIEISG